MLSLQEVILRRDGPGERLGLTLCYETDAEDGLTDIFIDDIHPDGLAAADGRLRLGDQIIQVRSQNYPAVPKMVRPLYALDLCSSNSHFSNRPMSDNIPQKNTGKTAFIIKVTATG